MATVALHVRLDLKSNNAKYTGDSFTEEYVPLGGMETARMKKKLPEVVTDAGDRS